MSTPGQARSTGILTAALAWVGGRTLAELRSAEAVELGGTAAVGAAGLVALVPGTLALEHVLRETALASHSALLAGAVMLGALALHHQLGRTLEVSGGLRRLLGRFVSASVLVGIAALGAARLPESLFMHQIEAHRVAMLQRGQAEQKEDQQLAQRLGQRQVMLKKQQWQTDRVQRQAQMPNLRVQALQNASQRCQQQLEWVKANLAEDTESPEDDRSMLLLQARANACAESEATLEQKKQIYELRVAQQVAEAKGMLEAAKAEVANAQQALQQHRVRVSQRLQREQPECTGAIPVCSLRQAVSSGHLEAWQAWGSSLIIGLLIALPALLRELVVADRVAQRRRAIAVVERHEERRWTKDMRAQA